jgi:hypothetical protein
MSKAYVVKIDPLGYCAKYQAYECKFTNDIEMAYQYSTFEGALARYNEAIEINGGCLKFNGAEVIEININIDIVGAVKIKHKGSLVCDELLDAITKRIEDAMKDGKYFTTLNSITDNGHEGIRGVNMYLSKDVYDDLCFIIKNKLGLGIRVNGIWHEVFWSKYKLS